MPTIAKGYSGCLRENFESKTKEELIDILINITQLKLERTDDWYPQEHFIDQDRLVDVLRGRYVCDEYFCK